VKENPIFTEENETISQIEKPELVLSKKETRRVMAGALMAGLLIGGIFLLAGFLFILFCIYVWL
jgi:predicted lipid-binding transport protein (Tim44 family)